MAQADSALAGAGGRPVEAEVVAEVRECCSSGLGNDWAVWKQDGQLAGLDGAVKEASLTIWSGLYENRTSQKWEQIKQTLKKCAKALE